MKIINFFHVFVTNLNKQLNIFYVDYSFWINKVYIKLLIIFIKCMTNVTMVINIIELKVIIFYFKYIFAKIPIRKNLFIHIHLKILY